MAFDRSNTPGTWRSAMILPFALLLAGCGTAFFPRAAPAPSETVEDGNADASGLRTIGTPRGEPNGDFDQAIPALFDQEGRAALRGSIQVVGDLDVYDLGLIQRGQRLIVDVSAGEGVLDSSVALFDERQRLLIDNDDRGGENRPLDSHINVIVRRVSARYSLVIGAAAFAGSGAERVGPYRIDVAVIRGGQAPPPVRQLLLLDFDGGPVDAPTIPVSFVEPFDADQILLRCAVGNRTQALRDVEPFTAEKITLALAGQTEMLKDLIVQTVRENFERFGVDVITSDDPLPDEGTFSTILFGGNSVIAFGIAESIDHFNADPADMVLVFTASFKPEVFNAPPEPAELAVAIGNVASHEAGHILGLNHVDDPRDLMDAVAPPGTLLLDQEFRVTPLSEQIMPIGLQDGPLLLNEIVGPN